MPKLIYKIDPSKHHNKRASTEPTIHFIMRKIFLNTYSAAKLVKEIWTIFLTLAIYVIFVFVMLHRDQTLVILNLFTKSLSIQTSKNNIF